MTSAEIVPLLRELFSRNPEYLHHEPWELQWILYALNYTDKLEDEGEKAGAVEALRVEGAVLL